MIGNLEMNSMNFNPMNTSQIQTLVFQTVTNFCLMYQITPKEYFMALHSTLSLNFPSLGQYNPWLKIENNNYLIHPKKEPIDNNKDLPNPFELLV